MGAPRALRLPRKWRDALAKRRARARAAREPEPRARRLLLHVGGPKCGSSAIQAALAANSAALAARGVLLASDRMDAEGGFIHGQVGYFDELKGRPDSAAELAGRFRRLAVAMDERAADTLVISAENLLLRTGAADMLIPPARAAGFTSEVVAYVRRWDDFLIAAWQQWGIKTHDSPEAYWKDHGFPSWLTGLRAWEDQAGLPGLKVFPFRRDIFPEGDVAAHFFEVNGLSFPGMVRPTPVNPSTSEHLSDLMNRARDLFADENDNDVLGILVPLIGPAAYKSGSASYFLTLDQRRALLEHAQADDEALKARYLPQFGAGPLFPPLRPEQVVECSEIDKLRAENALLLRAVHTLGQRLSALETRATKAAQRRRWRIRL